MTPDQLIDDILRREGDRYTDHPADKGGPTRYGITQETLASWRGTPVSKSEVANLTRDEARRIYYARYIQAPGFLQIVDPYLRGLAVDMGVNHGPPQAVRMMQRAAGVPVDGKLGPVTAAAINALDPRLAFRRMLAQRVRLYGQIITRDPAVAQAKQAGIRLQAENAHGWFNRVAEFLEQDL